YKVFQVTRTLLLVCFLKIFDCYPTLGVTFKAVASILTEMNWNILWDGSLMAIGLTVIDYVILVIGTLLLIIVSLLQRSGSVRDKIAVKPYPVRFIIWYGLFLVILLMGAYGMGYDASQFIYNRF
ncbi:MAG: MBOAT family protein, partial [Lachnospiraceae bacterium]|nr:MBOAT family protein [Lachnospiraceae bacterium]